jgi:hypothetical protein
MKHELSFSDFRFLDFSSSEFTECSVFVSKLPLYSASITEETNYRFLVGQLDKISWWTESLSMRTAHLEKGLWRYEAQLEFTMSELNLAEVKFLRSLQARLHRRPLQQRDWLDYDTAMDIVTERAELGWDGISEEGRKVFISAIDPDYEKHKMSEGCRNLHRLNFQGLQASAQMKDTWKRTSLAYAIIEKLTADIQNQEWSKQNVRV